MTELAAKDDEAIELVKEQALDGFNYFTRSSISQFVRRSPYRSLPLLTQSPGDLLRRPDCQAHACRAAAERRGKGVPFPRLQPAARRLRLSHL